MATREITLTDRFERFIEDSVAAGHYADASELVRDALRLLEQRRHEDELKLQRLREAVQVGFDQLDRGEYIELHLDDIDDYFTRKDEEAARRARNPAT